MKTYPLTYKSELLHADCPSELKTLTDTFISTLYDTEDDGWRIVSVSAFSTGHGYCAYILYEVIPELETLEHYEETIEARIKLSKEKEFATGIECPKCDNWELVFKDKMIMLSSPAQREIICKKCGFETTIFVP